MQCETVPSLSLWSSASSPGRDHRPCGPCGRGVWPKRTPVANERWKLAGYVHDVIDLGRSRTDLPTHGIHHRPSPGHSASHRCVVDDIASTAVFDDDSAATAGHNDGAGAAGYDDAIKRRQPTAR